MKILANKKIKELFGKITVCTVIFTLAAVLLTSFEAESVTLVIILCMVGMGAVILIFGYGYFKEQNEVMETAVSQIKEYISGNHEARIDCDEEGEVYRLFHEVNSLVTILNAHVEQERRSKQFLKNTISDISHQLKTPLAALNIYNGLLQGEAVDVPEIQEFTSLSEKELDRINTLVQNLLKITKLDAGSIVLEKKPEDVAEMMNNVELRFSYRAEQEQKKLVLFGEEDIFLSCDRDWILEAVDNIVKNAMDHTKSGDTIEIKWRKSASIVQIQIKDNGSGIHPEDLHHIFKRFYRSRFSKDQQGIGLGLPLAKMIIEAHNGTIEVNSELGKGTMFTISFLIPTKL
ncbi:sensor histidine kinase [Blautia obeum]|uniref:sensor histidine kinase n=1 Tax=Blautia obeum TaxID=40520 RepID=UPI000E523918|nr:HAMP domain-containing sensor histidine kinase [Blautia obeum]RHA45318.1 sensor histidine kinase [Blautia obeum]RHT48795.1 sensor histidine kinase [Ruminococcus sp. AM29-26]